MHVAEGHFGFVVILLKDAVHVVPITIIPLQHDVILPLLQHQILLNLQQHVIVLLNNLVQLVLQLLFNQVIQQLRNLLNNQIEVAFLDVFERRGDACL